MIVCSGKKSRLEIPKPIEEGFRNHPSYVNEGKGNLIVICFRIK